MNFPWQALNVVCEGVSALDIDRLEIRTESEAHQFLQSYGFDLYQPSHVDQLEKIFLRAVKFMQTYLCDEHLKIPEPLHSLHVGREFKLLLLLSTGSEGIPEHWEKRWQPWACAILRVMHVILHLQSDLRLKYIPKIRRQTVDRFSAHIQNSNEGLFLGYETDKIRLSHFEKKEAKVRDSVLLKLLHKPTAIAQEVHDHLGVRFITQTRFDAVRVVKYLIDHHLLSFLNVMSARCRNTLVSITELKKVIESLKDQELDARTIDSVLGYPKPKERENKFTSVDYHSLQFTTRQLIRIPVVRKGVKAEMSFFFPFEIQIFDADSYQKAQSGEAGHEAYKKKQLEAVRKRVLRGLI